jgi:fumarate reductase subunit C
LRTGSSRTIAASGLAVRAGRRRWPARLDVLQSASGLALVLFLWGHMFFVASILLGKDAMWTVTRFFEGYYLFGEAHPWIVSVIVAFVIALFVGHAVLALRKLPGSYRQYREFRSHMNVFHHADTSLWFWQAVTGFALMFLASPHLYVMLTQADSIGPYGSSDRVWSDRMWGLYVLLLLAVELHGGIGLYRLAVKWGWFANHDPLAVRARLRRLKWALTGFFLALGFLTLAAYIRIGIEHADRYGEPYIPAFVQEMPPPGGGQ